MRRGLLAASFLVAATTAGAAGPTEHYERMVGPYMIRYGHAQLAVACNLRSFQWLQPWDQWIWTIRTGFAREEGISGAEREAADKRLQNIAVEAYRSMPCDRLASSPIMDVLDRTQFRMTGGYH